MVLEPPIHAATLLYFSCFTVSASCNIAVYHKVSFPTRIQEMERGCLSIPGGGIGLAFLFQGIERNGISTYLHSWGMQLEWNWNFSYLGNL